MTDRKWQGPCDPCIEAINKWRDTNPSITSPGIRINNNATYDMTVAGVMQNRKNRHDDWRRLVNNQTELIKDICKRKHGAA